MPPAVPANEETSKEFEYKKYNISQWQELFCSCTTQSIELDADEMIFHKDKCCGGCLEKQTIKEPYAQMGAVEVEEVLGCCYSVDTDTANIQPQCGCAKELVQEISADLQERKVYRGNIAQLRHQENLIIEIIKLGIKIEMITRMKGINYLDQGLIKKVFGSDFIPAVTTRAYGLASGGGAPAQQAMAQPAKFDSETGQPIAQPGKFDPETGQPIPKFDPETGKQNW
jgi:hypothetical protein